jgi:hypothetical protein
VAKPGGKEPADGQSMVAALLDVGEKGGERVVCRRMMCFYSGRSEVVGWRDRSSVSRFGGTLKAHQVARALCPGLTDEGGAWSV